MDTIGIISWVALGFIIALNIYKYLKNRKCKNCKTGNPDPKPPKKTGNPDPKPPKKD